MTMKLVVIIIMLISVINTTTNNNNHNTNISSGSGRVPSVYLTCLIHNDFNVCIYRYICR